MPVISVDKKMQELADAAQSVIGGVTIKDLAQEDIENPRIS
jgi:hypothetical protein